MRPIPDDLVLRPTTRAAALAAGLTDRELAGPLWRRAFHGVHAWFGTDPSATRQRVLETAALLPSGGAITGWAAANLLGVPWADGLRWDGTPLPVPVVLPFELRLERRPEFDLLRSSVAAADLEVRNGVVVTSPRCTAFVVLCRQPLEPAVAAVDAILHAGLLRPEELAEFVRRQPRRRGVPQARTALPLLDGRSRSPYESVFRLVWTLEAGLPAPLVNPTIESQDGWMLGIADLLDEEAGLVGEFDGAGHRLLEQHSADNAREEELERTGLTVVRATSLDLHPGRRRLVHRLRAGRRSGLARDRTRDRWRVRPA